MASTAPAALDTAPPELTCTRLAEDDEADHDATLPTQESVNRAQTPSSEPGVVDTAPSRPQGSSGLDNNSAVAVVDEVVGSEPHASFCIHGSDAHHKNLDACPARPSSKSIFAIILLRMCICFIILALHAGVSTLIDLSVALYRGSVLHIFPFFWMLGWTILACAAVIGEVSLGRISKTNKLALRFLLVALGPGVCALIVFANFDTDKQGDEYHHAFFSPWQTGLLPGVPLRCASRVQEQQFPLFTRECYSAQFMRTFVYSEDHEPHYLSFNMTRFFDIRNNETLCSQGFEGNEDLYGLGIRGGNYVQWLAALLSNNLLPDNRKQGIRLITPVDIEHRMLWPIHCFDHGNGKLGIGFISTIRPGECWVESDIAQRRRWDLKRRQIINQDIGLSDLPPTLSGAIRFAFAETDASFLTNGGALPYEESEWPSGETEDMYTMSGTSATQDSAFEDPYMMSGALASQDSASDSAPSTLPGPTDEPSTSDLHTTRGTRSLDMV
ncbi:hypothetical protein S7711_10726 [Stachybotrys chartarum IBT 7711]|uniref:Uncharacterized protein n=1 Tax=Stachybotrys chartarum (strain CBS 109288 / IBT 7711) TaxID=1280523 RepID=A0A084AFX6_STACB|nr:hypothetical protein S7711_10726 [Stachybotrys chartarum IBT 7711]